MKRDEQAKKGGYREEKTKEDIEEKKKQKLEVAAGRVKGELREEAIEGKRKACERCIIEEKGDREVCL